MKIQNLIDNTQNYSPFSFPNQLASFLFMGITKSHKKGNIYEQFLLGDIKRMLSVVQMGSTILYNP